MRNSGFNHLLSGTALAAVLLAGGSLSAAPTTPDPAMTTPPAATPEATPPATPPAPAPT